MNRSTVCILFSVFAVATMWGQETKRSATVVATNLSSSTLPAIITVDGVTYSNVTWRTITPTTVSILHQTGAASIPLEKLSPELQDRFGYNPQKAAQYRVDEEDVRAKARKEREEAVVRAPVPQAPATIPAQPVEHESAEKENADSTKPIVRSKGLHGYIAFTAANPPGRSEYGASMGFYSAVWSMIDQPLAGFQVGLPSSWILPDNSDDKSIPLAPEDTKARTTMPERGPTWANAFQTIEGGPGYWGGNRFRYGSPKFSMNGTPQCYDYMVGSPGWAFFESRQALPDDRLSIAQLSNRLLIPPDGLTFEGKPNGEFIGYSWMALPFTDPSFGKPPTGDQSWTCFLNTANFKGPIAYYIPETWSKIGKLFNYPFDYGRGLDARPGTIGGGAMEINTVPRLDAPDAQGTMYSKIPKLQFPTDDRGRTLLVQDVTLYSKAAIFNAFQAWRSGGPACSGQFDGGGAWRPKLTTQTTAYEQDGNRITGVEHVFNTKIFEENVWGLEWFKNDIGPQGAFPQYFKHVGDKCVAVAVTNVPAETKLIAQEFKRGGPGRAYTSPTTGAWSSPGPKGGPFAVKLADGSVVTYSWYRFIDQPSFQQYNWSKEKKEQLQAIVEKIHAYWPIDRNYMAAPTHGSLVALDPALFVTPPKGLEVGYVPIVTRQAAR